jgi:hypothetical protein
MAYPTTTETFTLQVNRGEPGATQATAEFINAVTALLVKLETKVGLDGDVAATASGPTAGSVEARLKRVENSANFKRSINTTAPATGNVIGDEWFDNTTPVWPMHTFTSAGWQLVSANAVQLLGRTFDTTPPTDGQAIVWDNTASKLKFGTVQLPPGLTNPLTVAGSLIVAGTPPGTGQPAPFTQLLPGGNGAFLQIAAGVPTWQTPAWINNSLLVSRGDMIVATGTGAPAALASGGSANAGYVLALDGTGYPTWMAGYMQNPMTNPNDLIIGGTSGAPARLLGGADELNNWKVLTLHGNTAGTPPTLAWEWPTPADTLGDLVYGLGGHRLQRLGIGPNGYYLSVVGGVPAWVVAPTGGTGGGISGISVQQSGTLVGGAGVVNTLDFIGATISVVGTTAHITTAGGGGGSGTVTSVGITMPAIFTVTGSPVTAAGTLSVALNAQPAGRFLAGPLIGGSAVPAFRVIGGNDLPVFIGSGATHAPGAVPDPGLTAGAARYLCENGTWAIPPSAGGGVNVQDEGGALAAATVFNFVGSGVSMSVSSGTAVVTIPGGNDPVLLTERSAQPTVPATGFAQVYARADHLLYRNDNAGNQYRVSGHNLLKGDGSAVIERQFLQIKEPAGATWSDNGSDITTLDLSTITGGGGGSDGLGSIITPAPPATASLTLVNSGAGVTWTDETKGAYAEITANSGHDLKMAVRALPAAPYRVRVGFYVNCKSDNTYVGLVLRDSVTGKAAMWGLRNTDMAYAAHYFSSPTTFDSFIAGSAALPLAMAQHASVWWFEIYDDGTNRHFRFLADGSHGVDMFTTASSAFFTPNQYGIGINAGGATNWPNAMFVHLGSPA